MKLRTLALAAIVLTVAAVVIVIAVRARGRGELDASSVIDPYLRRIQAGDFSIALDQWAPDASERPTAERLRDDWRARQQERGTLERWRVAAAIPGGNVFTGESWVDARVWLWFSDAPATHVPVEWRIEAREGRPRIVRLVVDPTAVGEADAERVF